MLLAYCSIHPKRGCVVVAGVSEQLCLLCDYLLFQPTADLGQNYLKAQYSCFEIFF